jgi:hypothetical protein
MSCQGVEYDMVADDATTAKDMSFGFSATSKFTLTSSMYMVITGIEFFKAAA